MRVLKRRYLESGFTNIFILCNLGNTLAMTIMTKCLKFDVDSRNETKNSEKLFRF